MGEKSVDLYRDTPVRLLGYANEVGESFRSLVHVNWVRLSYGIASAYVLADTFDKARKANQKIYASAQARRKAVVTVTADTLIWQSFASVVIPGIAINRICAASLFVLKRSTKLDSLTRRWVTTAIGLVCIPLIYKPIDHFVDDVMDITLRKVIYVDQSEKRDK